MDRILLKSFSKINIGLKIINKRENGYHNIHTVFQEIDFHEGTESRGFIFRNYEDNSTTAR